MGFAEKSGAPPRGGQDAAVCLYVRDMLEQLGKIASDLEEHELATAILTAVDEARRTVTRKITIGD